MLQAWLKPGARVTRSVTVCIPTQSVGTIDEEFLLGRKLIKSIDWLDWV
jgi:hypothetical protein